MSWHLFFGNFQKIGHLLVGNCQSFAKGSRVQTMIKSFRHKGLKKLFTTGNAAGVNPQHKQKIKDQLEFLHSAECVEDMDLPGYDLHELKGRRVNEWSITVSKNWRIVFKFEDGDAYDVEVCDYH